MRRNFPAAALIAAIIVTAAPARAAEVALPSLFDGDAPRAAAIYDVQGERFLGTYRAAKQLPPASLMKMVTALVVAEYLAPTDPVTISSRAVSVAANDTVRWRRGATFTADEVLHGMLMMSSNGAAIALAEAVAGSVEDFRPMAARTLKRIGASDTVLKDPSGLDARGQYSTARDMALIASAVLANDRLAEIVNRRSYDLPWPDGGRAEFGNLNEYLLRDRTAIGVKHGFTSAAGNTVAAASWRKGRVHIVVVLGGADPFAVAKNLMDHAFTVAPGTDRTAKRPRSEPQTEVLGLTITRDADGTVARSPDAIAGPIQIAGAPEPVALDGASTPRDRPGSPTGMRLMIAVAFATYVARVVQVNRRRAHRLAARLA